MNVLTHTKRAILTLTKLQLVTESKVSPSRALRYSVVISRKANCSPLLFFHCCFRSICLAYLLSRLRRSREPLLQFHLHICVFDILFFPDIQVDPRGLTLASFNFAQFSSALISRSSFTSLRSISTISASCVNASARIRSTSVSLPPSFANSLSPPGFWPEFNREDHLEYVAVLIHPVVANQ